MVSLSVMKDFSNFSMMKDFCAGMMSLKRPWPRYNMTHIIMAPVLYGLKCAFKAKLRSTRRAAARPGRLSRRPGPHARCRVPPGLDRWDLPVWYAVQASQACAHVKHPIWQAASDDSAPRSIGAAKRNGVEENPCKTQDRPVTAAACQIHILHKFCKFFPSQASHP